MKKVPSGFSPIVALDRRTDKPLYKQVYEAFCAAIVGGNLRARQRVPSSRSLANELKISRIPILTAYSQLLAEGYFESRYGSGTFVSSTVPDQGMALEGRYAASPTIRSGRRLVSKRLALLPSFKPVPWLNKWGAFIVGQLAFEHFPFQVWARLVNRHVRNVRVNSLHYGDPMGCETFRGAIAQYLRTARAVNCDASQIMIVSGSQQALELTARVLLDPGDKVWIEEPGYRLAQNVFAVAGCRLVPVPVDAEGMDVAAGIHRSPKARAAFVTPSHQFPLGVTMSASRRLQLLDWVHHSASWIIEDDYDNEYRYESMPIASLQGLDRDSRVIYIGTFSKTLFPSLRLGYVVIPPDLIQRFLAVRNAMDVCPPHLYQAVLEDFIVEGHFARHIRRTRLVYSERRTALGEAIRTEFGTHMEVLGADAGVHLVVELPRGFRDRRIATAAARQNLWLWPLSSCHLDKPSRQGFILGFGSTTPKQIPNAVRKLRDVIKSQ
ncbi:MAG TPA: PLP-dependent aminotransferase family protein [Candidatus Acidoferrum sp.]|nr:PLP-dependent aminotransferase family protein [Candidatus Acidoferrum sp.]